MNAGTVSTTEVGDVTPTRDWGRVSFLAVAIGLTGLAFAGLYSFGVVGDVPLVGLLGLLALASAAGQLAARWYRAGACGWRLHLLVAVQMAGVTSIIYAIGWGPTLSIGYVFVVAGDLEEFGSRVWRTALGWIVVCMLCGEAAFAAGLAHSYVSRPYVDGLAGLSMLGVGFVVRLLGVKTADQEEAAAALRSG